MDKKVIVGVVGITLLLAGCGTKQAQTKTTSSTSETTSSKTTKSSASRSKAKSTTLAVWTSAQNKELATFMKQWQQTMKQSYASYDGKNELKTSTGLSYPTDLKTATVSGSSAKLTWSPKGQGKAGYNVVALYNYDKSSGGSITYAFAIKDGKPVVLVNETTSATNTWSETQNKTLRAGFMAIFNGEKASVASSTSSSVASSSSATSSASSSADSASSSSSSTNGPTTDGRDGYFTIPQALQGTWYAINQGRLTKYTISDHEIVRVSAEGETTTIELYNAGDRHYPPTQEELEKTQNWGTAELANVNGIEYLNVRSWYQMAGAGSYYGAHTESINGTDQPVLVTGFGADAWTDTVYYQSEALARQQANVKYDDLIY